MSVPAALGLSPIDGIPLPDGELLVGDETNARARGTVGGAARAVDVIFLAPGAASLATARRLVGLGSNGIGGCCAGGRSGDDRIVLLRLRAARSVADLASGERLAEVKALSVIRDIAGALAAAEEKYLFPGPLRPADIALPDRDEASWIVAEPLVGSLLASVTATAAASGSAAGAATPGTGPSPRWTPPEQAEGASWDAAANRYVLGLIAYRLLAGEHPFSGAGLRHALEAQAHREPPPFAEDVARALTPGVQSFVLSLLHPRIAKRPQSAIRILDALHKLFGAAPVGPPAAASRAIRPTASVAAVAPERVVPSARPARVARAARPSRAALIVIGISTAAALLALALGPTKGAAETKLVAEPKRGPLTARNAESCAPCHAKQVEEWQRSVMAFAAKSPLYRSLESAVEEQVGRDGQCPGGAGVLRKRGANACVDPTSGSPVTGSGGEHWCVHCHAPLDQLASRVPAWDGISVASRTRAPLGDVLSKEGAEGVTCVACHTSIGPVEAHARARNVRAGVAPAAYEGNPSWFSTRTGQEFSMRPEDARGITGIANSGYRLDSSSFFLGSVTSSGPGVHGATSRGAASYLRSSEFCGACHDVRLFGTDVLGARDRGEHFKRLRNAYSEWQAWATTEERAGRSAASCQGCHMSAFPGSCVTGAPRTDLKSDACPPGTGFIAKRPGERGAGGVASHYFTGVEVPFAEEFPEAHANTRGLDADGVPIGLRARRDLLLRSAFSFEVGSGRIGGDGALTVPLTITNVGAGHRVPAGFSQERETWVELRVTDARGSVFYEVGRVDRADEDLKDKRFLRVRVDEDSRDGRGRPQGVFGADIADGPDVPKWSPDPSRGGTTFAGLGLINFQNGFLRCVQCIGIVGADGACLPGPGQGATRADRFADGIYDQDTGECRSNLSSGHELFETYFPVGSLDADRGTLRAPDAIIDTRSAPPNVPLHYTYIIPGAATRPRPLHVEARLRFRSFPPFLVRAFAAYEREQARRGQRPNGPQVTDAMLQRLDIIDLATASLDVR